MLHKIKKELCAKYYRRRAAVKKLKHNPSEEYLWETVVLFQRILFRTATGLDFCYKLRTGRRGDYTKELWIDRREKSKSLAWSSVRLAFQKCLDMDGVVGRPKALGDIRGISYIYPILWRFGMIQVPKRFEIQMKVRPPKVTSCRWEIPQDQKEENN